MSSANYRVEKSSSARAVCQATECKKAGTKIAKGVLRLGTWVTYEDRGGWKWRHWGCVTGKVLENIRDGIEDPEKPGRYRWDYLDGYEGEDKHGLQDSPELQAKVRRVINQGFIDQEDWNGDPEMNKLGEKGMLTKESLKKKKDDQKADGIQKQLDELKAQLDAVTNGANASVMEARIKELEETLEQFTNPTPKKKAAPRKRKAMADDDDDDESEEEKKPAVKKRATKKEAGDDADIKSDPKKARAKKNVVKKEDSEDSSADVKPAPKSRAKKGTVKKEEVDIDTVAEDVKPASKVRAKKGAVKKEEVDEMEGIEEDIKPTPKPRAKKGAVKKELIEKDDDEEEVKPAPKPRAKKGAVKKEASENDDEEEEAKPAPAKKRAPPKKAVKNPVEEDDADAESAPPAAKPAPRKRGKATKKEVIEDVEPDRTEAAEPSSALPNPVDNDKDELAGTDDGRLEVVSPEVKSKKGGRAKSLAVPSKRGSRSRTSSAL